MSKPLCKCPTGPIWIMTKLKFGNGSMWAKKCRVCKTIKLMPISTMVRIKV